MSTNPDTFFLIDADATKAKHMPIVEGMTVGQLFTETLGEKSASNYLARMRAVGGGANVPAAMDHVIQAGESISFTATNIKEA